MEHEHPYIREIRTSSYRDAYCSTDEHLQPRVRKFRREGKKKGGKKGGRERGSKGGSEKKIAKYYFSPHPIKKFSTIIRIHFILF